MEISGNGVLVTGGAGFIGSALIRALVRRGARIVSVDNLLHGNEMHLREVASDIRIVRGDIRNTSLVRELLNDHAISYVFNCAGDTFVPEAYESPDRFLEMNTASTLALLTAARETNILRIVHLSTTEVYGDQPETKLNEKSPLNPGNTYAVTKLAADRLCQASFWEHGTPVVIARLFNAYGPRETHPYIVPEIIRQLAHGNKVVSLGNLESERDLTYVDDTATALIALLGDDIPDGEVFNVGSDNAFTVRELVDMIGTAFGQGKVTVEVDARRLRRREITRFRCDNTKLRRMTGWKPATHIDDGLRQTIAWHRQQPAGWSWEGSSGKVRT